MGEVCAGIPGGAMTFDIDKITASKEARRRRLTALPYRDKLRLLDRMRERDAALERARSNKRKR